MLTSPNYNVKILEIMNSLQKLLNHSGNICYITNVIIIGNIIINISNISNIIIVLITATFPFFISPKS